MSNWFWSFWQAKGRFALLGIGIGLMIWGVILAARQQLNQPTDVKFYPSQEQSEISEQSSQQLVIDIAGAVVKPGVYRFEQAASGFRLSEAIEAAGGITDQAAFDWIDKNLNLARRIKDGEKIYIPFKNDFELGVENQLSGQIAGMEINSMVNLNLANKEELISLPEIGPATAEKIIDYREQKGGFVSIEEIMAVSGIGEKTFEKIKDKITI